MVKDKIMSSDGHSILAKASKALVDDYYKMDSYPQGAVPPEEDFSILKDIVLKDEEVRGFLGSINDALVASGYQLIGSQSAVESAKKRLYDLRFNKHLKKMYHNLLAYQHTFIELIPNKAQTKVGELRVWSPIKIEPVSTKHGEIKKYIIKQNTAEVVSWNLDEMVHISVDHITDGFWTYPQLKTLERLIKLKDAIMSHLLWAYQTNQFRIHFHATGLGEDDIEWFTMMLKEGMYRKDKFLVTVGSDSMEGKQIMNPSDVVNHIEMLNKVRNLMLTILRVPPIIAGTVDNSNRSNSEIQARFSFTTRIRSLQKDIEDEMEFYLFPKLGIKNVKLKHNIVDIKNDIELVNIAQNLLNMGASKSKTTDWLNERGLDIPPDIFELTPEEESEKESNKPDTGRDFPPNSDQYPSRKEQDNFGKPGYGVK